MTISANMNRNLNPNIVVEAIQAKNVSDNIECITIRDMNYNPTLDAYECIMSVHHEHTLSLYVVLLTDISNILSNIGFDNDILVFSDNAHEIASTDFDLDKLDSQGKGLLYLPHVESITIVHVDDIKSVLRSDTCWALGMQSGHTFIANGKSMNLLVKENDMLDALFKILS